MKKITKVFLKRFFVTFFIVGLVYLFFAMAFLNDAVNEIRRQNIESVPAGVWTQLENDGWEQECVEYKNYTRYEEYYIPLVISENISNAFLINGNSYDKSFRELPCWAFSDYSLFNSSVIVIDYNWINETIELFFIPFNEYIVNHNYVPSACMFMDIKKVEKELCTKVTLTKGLLSPSTDFVMYIE